MTRKIKKESFTLPVDRLGCCKVESLINVDERGQMVLPKELRDKTNIRAGNKLALVSWEKDGKICCFTLIKADEFTEMVKRLLGPMMKELILNNNQRRTKWRRKTLKKS